MTNFTIYTDHPEGGLVDVGYIDLKGFQLISQKELSHLRSGGDDGVQQLLADLRDHLASGSVNKRKAQALLSRVRHALGEIA